MVSTLFSCKNENSVNPRPSDQIIGKATITGRVKAELNTTNTSLESVPDGIKVIAEISTADLVLNPTGITYPKKYYETTTKNGEYSIDVEVGPNGTNVVLYFTDFRADVTTATNPISTLFVGSTKATSVIKGRSKIVDYTY